MTMHREKRCWHCQVRYYYQSSGYGCNEDFNDDKYCPECMEVISKALKTIPKKVEKVWVPVSEVFGDKITLDILLQWKRERKEEARVKGNIYAERLAFPLFDLTGKRTEHSGVVFGRGEEFKGYTFEYRYWTKSRDFYTTCDDTKEDIKISVEMERELASGLLSRWYYLE
jgi:hypothetical protein